MAKKVENSKHHVVGADPLTESMFGEGAIRIPECRIVVKRGGKGYLADNVTTVNKLGIYGVGIHSEDITNDDEKLQMWDCEIIIIPRKKYRDGFNGKRADQILCSGVMGEPDLWKEEIFSKE